jgi:uncharacterized repeat protein (TIGR02543 family)
MNEDKKIIHKEEEEEDKERKRRKPFWLWFLLGLVLVTAISAFGFITLSSSTTTPSSSSSTTTSSSNSSSSTPPSSSATPYSISYSYRTIQAPRFQHLSTGITHSIGKTTNGQVYAFGSNEFGNIGNGTTAFTPTHPTLISFTGLQDGETIRDVIAGQFSTFAVTSNGRVYAWGLNSVGQLGDNSTVNKFTPTLISFTDLQDGETIRNVLADEYHSLAVTTNGRVYAWGRNTSGQLGDNTLAAKRIPTLISFTDLQNGETIKNVAAGNAHSLAVTTTGRVYSWGSNSTGQLGKTGIANSQTPTLISFPVGETIRDVLAAGDYSHALTTTGLVYSMGLNDYGQLGDGTNTNKSTPTLISFTGLQAGETIRNVFAGQYHTLAVTTNGRVYAWGMNFYGELGDGTTAHKSSPTLISFTGLEDGETVRDVYAGDAHSLAVTTNNRLYAWGYNPFGQHGDKTTVNKLIPTPVFDLTTTLVNNYHTVNYGDTITSTLPNPTLAGHTFVGWFMDEALTVQYNLTTMPAEDVTLYASFKQ